MVTVVLHRFHQEVGDRYSYLRINLIRSKQWVRLAVGHLRNARQRVRRNHSSHQIVERCGESIEIAAWTCARALNLFERSEVWREAKDRAARHHGRSLPCRPFSQSKI